MEGLLQASEEHEGKCCHTEDKYVVMVNFVCQLDWVMGCPDIWSNLILDVSVRVLLDEINI